MTAWLAFAPVGLWLLATGLGKALDLRFAALALEGHGLPEGRPARIVAAVLAVAEAALGGALLAGAALAAWLALPLLLAGLAAGLRAWWRGLDDCGCHGVALRVPPGLSAALAALAAGLLAIGLTSGGGAPAGAGSLALAGATGIAAAALAGWSGRHGAPLDLARLRPGRRWRRRWLPGFVPRHALLVFARTECGHCVGWLQRAEALAALPEAPPVVAVFAGRLPPPSLHAAQPMPVSGPRLARLAPRPPLAVLLRDGVIAEIWEADMPPWVTARLVAAARGAAPPG